MKRLMLLLFILMALTQWIVPSQMLWEHYNVIKKGHAFKFKTVPVDPVDYFKGRYVSLDFEANSFPVDSTFDLQIGTPIYVRVGTNAAGYAKIIGVSTKHDFSGDDYVKATVRYTNYDDSLRASTIHINFPFAKYFMEESKAPLTEEKFRVAQKLKADSYATVNIYKGNGLLTGLTIGKEKIK